MGYVLEDVSVDDEDRTDAMLLRRIGRDDRAAFDQFYQRTAPWVLMRLRRRCRDEDMVADALQETFVTIWRTAGGYTGAGSPAGWVWSVATSRLVDVARARLAKSRAPLDQAFWSQLPPIRRATQSAEDEALGDALEHNLVVALDGLSPELRAVLQATVLDGLTTRETAVLLGIPEGTVKTRARRARMLLREALS